MLAIFRGSPRFTAPGHQSKTYHASREAQQVEDWVRDSEFYKKLVACGRILELRETVTANPEAEISLQPEDLPKAEVPELGDPEAAATDNGEGLESSVLDGKRRSKKK